MTFTHCDIEETILKRHIAAFDASSTGSLPTNFRYVSNIAVSVLLPRAGPVSAIHLSNLPPNRAIGLSEYISCANAVS